LRFLSEVCRINEKIAKRDDKQNNFFKPKQWEDFHEYGENWAYRALLHHYKWRNP